MARKRRRRLPDGTDAFEEVDDDDDSDYDLRITSVETELQDFYQKSLGHTQQLSAVKAKLDKLARDLEEGNEGDDELFKEIDELKAECGRLRDGLQHAVNTGKDVKARVDDVSGLGPLEHLPGQLQEATQAAMAELESSLLEKIRSQDRAREEESEIFLGRFEELNHQIEESLAGQLRATEAKLAKIESRLELFVARDQMEQRLQNFESKAVERIRMLESRIGQLDTTFQGNLANHTRELHQVRDSLTATIDELASHLDERASHEDLSKVKTELGNLSGRLGSIAALDDKLRASSGEIQRLESWVGEHRSKLESLLKESQQFLSVIEEHQSKVNIAVRLVDEVTSRAQGGLPTGASLAAAPAPVSSAAAVDLEAPETTEHGFTLRELLDVVTREKASDLLISAGTTPCVRLDGALIPVGDQNLSSEDCRRLVFSAVAKNLRPKLVSECTLDSVTSVDGLRVRVLSWFNNGNFGGCLQPIGPLVSWEELGLPAQFRRLVTNRKQGLFVLSGAMVNQLGMVLASLVDTISQTNPYHIVSVDELSEHEFGGSRVGLVTQLQVGESEQSYSHALRQASKLRPDVLILGRLRSHEALELAIDFAASGKLVLAGLECRNITDGAELLFGRLFADASAERRAELASVLNGFLWHKVLPRADKQGTVLCSEWYANSAEVTNMLLSGRLENLATHVRGLRGEHGRSLADSMEALVETGLVKESTVPRGEQSSSPTPPTTQAASGGSAAAAPPAHVPPKIRPKENLDETSDSNMGWL